MKCTLVALYVYTARTNVGANPLQPGIYFSINALIIFQSRNERRRYPRVSLLVGSLWPLKNSSSFHLCLYLGKVFAVRSRLCVSVSQRASPRILHTDTCLYVLITDVYFTPTLASSRPPMALPLSLCPEQVQHR